MDTSKLLVGQKVSMSSGIFSCEGQVIRVSSEGVEVKTHNLLENEKLRFDLDRVAIGNGRDYGAPGSGGTEHGALDYEHLDFTVSMDRIWRLTCPFCTL